MSVDPVAAAGFSADADRYERTRSGYPSESVSLLVRALDLGPGRAVLDVGAGTGKLARLLVPSGARVLAVEPVEAMAERLCALVAQVELVGGAAESIQLPDAAVDAVTCGQSFHWFATRRAVAELVRVLRPAGRLALVWNEWSYDAAVQPWLGGLGALFDELAGPDTPRSRTGAWRAPLDGGPFTDLGRTSFANDEDGTVETVLERLLTTSYIAALGAEELRAATAQLRGLVEAGASDGRVAIPQQTHVDLFALRPAGR